MKRKASQRLARPARTALLEAAIALGLSVTAAGPVLAQTGTVEGRVTNEVTGAPLAAAAVTVVGTPIGTLTREDGVYALVNVPAGMQEIRVTLIGFGTVTQDVTVQVGASASLDFELRARPIEMEGIVVTGMATEVRRRELPHDVSLITSAELENAPVSDIHDVLQGRATGSVVMPSSGMEGSGAKIRLRGNNSFAMGNQPLIYVDGVRLYASAASAADEANQSTSGLDDINPADIERVEIVKGPAASTLYGTEASGGVIQIFTKRGTPGRPIWTLNTEWGYNQLGHVGPDKDINPTGLYTNDCRESDPLGCPASGSWLRNGFRQNYDLSVRGGTANMNYFVSARYGSQDGVIDPQRSEGWSARGNFGFDPSDVLNIQFNNSFSHREVTWIPDGDNAEGLLLNVWRGDGDYTPDHDDSAVLEMDLESQVDHFITGLTVNYTPLTNFFHRLAVGLDYSNTEYTEERPYQFFRVPDGDRENDTYLVTVFTLDYAGTWQTSIGESWTSAFSFGGQRYDGEVRRINGFGYDFGGPGDKELDSGARTEVSEFRREVTSGGFFLQERLGWMDRAFLTVGVRWDGFSTFGDDFGWATYPKVGASYLISEHEFWPDWWETLKLRAALGYSGKAPGYFDAEKVWEEIGGDEATPAVTPENLGESGLGPEKTQEWEFGFEGSFLDGRVSFDFNYFNQTTSDALVQTQQIPSNGFIGTQLLNVGEVRNWGTEVFIDVGLLRYTNFDWDIGFRYSTHNSEARDIGDLDLINFGGSAGYNPEIRSCGWEMRADSAAGKPSSEWRPDRCYGVPGFWGDKVLNPNAVGVEPETEEAYLGPAYPTRSWGISTSLTLWRGLTLDALGEAQGGHVMVAGTARQNVRRGEWPACEVDPEGRLADDPNFTKSIRDRVIDGEIEGITALQQYRCKSNPRYDAWTMAADFFRLRQASLSYRIPERFMRFGVRGATIRIAARNLFLITDFEGIDPEAVEDGSLQGPTEDPNDEFSRIGYYVLPPTKTFLVSLTLTF
ncbi:MAG: TonB-dependent receptor [Gemmatimonadota bacterium]|nr:MAG: TonB-dependent receptor [Gemmatimonadota bacterium]